jgi:dienelactone hydrolase
MRKFTSLLFLGLLLSACGRLAAAGSATATPTLAPVHVTTIFATAAAPAVTTAPASLAATPAATGTPAGSAVPGARPTPSDPLAMPIAASDGATLSAEYYPPVIAIPVAGQKAPGVLLLEMVGGSRADWDPFARQLQAQGMAALVLDFRGQGATAGPADWTKSVDDARAGWQALLSRPEVDPQRTALIGASIGANVALIVGANNNQVAAVAALSPGDNFQGIQPGPLLGNFGSRPVYLIASQDDAYSYASAQHMAPALAGGDTFYYTNAGHGTAMFSNPDLATRLLNWLGVKIGNAKG